MKMAPMKILAINPGSTSTKVALFEDEKMVFKANVNHDAKKLDEFPTIPDQYDYRLETINQVLKEQGCSLDGLSAVAARAGSVYPGISGIYEVNDLAIKDSMAGVIVKHPAMLGPSLARGLAEPYGARAFYINPPDTDELCDYARVTGVKGVYRTSNVHALNQKEVALRVAAKMGKKYEDLNMVVAHLGGGSSITAHQKGRMIDNTSNVCGEGPMTPTRCGEMPAKAVIDLCFSGKYTEKEVRNLLTKSGGYVDHLGTSDAYEVYKMGKAGDEYAQFLIDAMLYQSAKFIGAMAAAMDGDVDAVILTGGMAQNEEMMGKLEKKVKFIAPVYVVPGENEMEALGAGALRVLRGEEVPKQYDGQPAWKGFSFVR